MIWRLLKASKGDEGARSMRCPDSPIHTYNGRLHTVAQAKANRPSRIVSAAGRASSPCARLEHNSTSITTSYQQVGARHMSGRSKVGRAPLLIYINTASECKLLAPKCEGVYLVWLVSWIKCLPTPLFRYLILSLRTLLTGDIPCCSACYKGV